MKRAVPRSDHLLDALGQMLQVGDRATLVYIDRLYLYGLPVEQQAIYETHLDQLVTLRDFDDCGTVAIAFKDASGTTQEFWIEPRWLKRLPI
jgi:hypothetical protein